MKTPQIFLDRLRHAARNHPGSAALLKGKPVDKLRRCDLYDLLWDLGEDPGAIEHAPIEAAPLLARRFVMGHNK